MIGILIILALVLCAAARLIPVFSYLAQVVCAVSLFFVSTFLGLIEVVGDIFVLNGRARSSEGCP
ncbi:hypothetical protein [Methylorubrum aminovorans]